VIAISHLKFKVCVTDYNTPNPHGIADNTNAAPCLDFIYHHNRCLIVQYSQIVGKAALFMILIVADSHCSLQCTIPFLFPQYPDFFLRIYLLFTGHGQEMGTEVHPLPRYCHAASQVRLIIMKWCLHTEMKTLKIVRAFHFDGRTQIRFFLLPVQCL
jgi:hypothetical protein